MISEIGASIITFLVFMNPFGLFIYLDPVMRDMSRRDFAVVLLKATVISFGIYYFHAVLGEPFFNRVLQIDFEAFRMFGGITITLFSLVFIVGGKRSYLSYKPNLNELASEIALPFMVGAGTIALSILMGNQFGELHSFWMLAFILGVTYLSVLYLQRLRDSMPERIRAAFNNIMEVFLRINSFFMGAVGVHMFITGLNNLYF